MLLDSFIVCLNSALLGQPSLQHLSYLVSPTLLSLHYHVAPSHILWSFKVSTQTLLMAGICSELYLQPCNSARHIRTLRKYSLTE